MVWTSPRTWIAGEVLTAALLNTHLRDNLSAIVADSGDVNVPLISGYNGGIASCRTVGPAVWLRVETTKNGSTGGAGSIAIGTVPSAAQPTYVQTFTLLVNGVACQASVLPIGDPNAGNLVLSSPGITAGQTIKGSASWPIGI